MRRGVFGGSFDPVHLGHLTVAAAAADRLLLESVHFVPAREQPFKIGGHVATPGDRVAMLELALALADERFALDTRELEREGPSYTVDTLRSLRAEFPVDELCLLVGADTARDLLEWREAEAIPALARIIVLTRPGAEMPGLEEAGELLEVPRVDVSATEVRERVGRGEPIDDMVPLAVAEYIESHRLYSAGD
jgi:nicotinate-nucleotide adenylyltransferase